MRLWSIHPKYLDSKGLVALWRETLLAKNVLLGVTKGYKNHPQLIRFKLLKDPVAGINTYLNSIYEESLIRNYKFNNDKIDLIDKSIKIEVTKGQLMYEFNHLLNKLKDRDLNRYQLYLKDTAPKVNSMFQVINGDIEPWERI